MDISQVIADNLGTWMAANPSLSTIEKVAAKSHVGFGTVRRTRNGEGNTTIQNLDAIAKAFGRRVEHLLIPTTGSAALEQATPYTDLVPIARVLLTLSAGISGYSVEHPEVNGDPIFFRRDFLQRKGWKADCLLALKVAGDSMEPALYAGDLVIVNTADTNPADGEVFAVNYEGESIIKRLRRDAGQWWLDSDNARHKPKLCDDHAILLGRICYRQTERI